MVLFRSHFSSDTECQNDDFILGKLIERRVLIFLKSNFLSAVDINLRKKGGI